MLRPRESIRYNLFKLYFKYKPFFKFLWTDIEGRTTQEKLYNYFHPQRTKCSICRGLTNFISYDDGYRIICEHPSCSKRLHQLKHPKKERKKTSVRNVTEKYKHLLDRPFDDIKSDIIKLCDANINSLVNTLHHYHPEFIQYLDNKYPYVKTLSEKLYIFCYDPEHICGVCGELTKYRDWKHGYGTYCGNTCKYNRYST